MYYAFEDDNQRYDSPEEVLNVCVTEDQFIENDEGFCSYIDETEHVVEISGYEWPASEVLKNMGDYVYDEVKRAWAEGEVEYYRQEFYGQLERLSAGDYVDIFERRVFAFEDEDEEESDSDQYDMAKLEEKLAKEKAVQAGEAVEQQKTEAEFLLALGFSMT